MVNGSKSFRSAKSAKTLKASGSDSFRPPGSGLLAVSTGQSHHSARVALGGVATKPWRARAAEEALAGHPPSEPLFRHAADAALAGAEPRKYNAFKIELARRTLVRALTTVAEGA